MAGSWYVINKNKYMVWHLLVTLINIQTQAQKGVQARMIAQGSMNNRFLRSF